jgi:Putative peptidoglycan binding domain
MNSQAFAKTATVAALALVFAGCSGMSHTQKDTTVGAATGAVAGAVVAGPVGAVVGGVGGAVVGHEVGKDHTAQGRPGVTGPNPPIASNAPYSLSTVRSVQQALNAKGFNAGPVDGQWGPSTEIALKRFQTAQGLPSTGALDARTLNALGVV